MLSTVPKGIVGGFEFTVLQRNFEKKWHGHGRMFATAKGKKKKCRFDRNSVLIIAHIILPFGITLCTFFPTAFLEVAV